MSDAARQLHFNKALERFSARLNELLLNARSYQSSLPIELLDEVAYVTGELTIVLTNHDEHQDEGPIKEVLILAQSLRRHLRSNQLGGEQLIQAFDSFKDKIEQLLGRDKMAA